MSSKMESKKDGQSFDKSLLDVGGGLSEERKMTLLRRFNAQTEELDIEEDDDEDFWANIDLNRMSRLDIKIALQARGLSTRGNKTKIRLRLEQSIEEEKQDELEFLAMVEAARRAEAALEEGGAVYSAGDNRRAQLGVGDLRGRESFTVVRPLRSKGVASVHCGHDISLALSEDGNTYSWGGGGTGPVGYARPPTEDERKKRRRVAFMGDDSDDDNKGFGSEADSDEELDARGNRKEKSAADKLKRAVSDDYKEPKLIVGLEGEGIVDVAIGPTHGAAISDGGDLYTWGGGVYGQLGIGDFDVHHEPTILESMQDGSVVRQLVCGHDHTVAVSDRGVGYAWGFANSGKLGLGVMEREGVERPFSRYFPTPIIIDRLKRVHVAQVACGPNHSMALTDEGVVYSWGAGDGGRLGHGDDKDREQPTLIKFFSPEDKRAAQVRHIVLQIACGYWHSAAIVLVPPYTEGGYVYTWGSGFAGQLGQGVRNKSRLPKIVEPLLDAHVVSTRIKCGSHHNIILSDTDDLWAWGSNRYGCLGAPKGKEPPAGYTATPIMIDCFNTMINRVGRGVVRDFDVGQYFTVVCTYPYQGPPEEQLIAMEEEALRRAQEDAEDRNYEEMELERERREDEKRDKRQQSNNAKQAELDAIAAEDEGNLNDIKGNGDGKPIYAR
tara:strand:- start:442 stop:2439 length:1998 start_codon:yes stop_codon:yes gene_type:complete